jgi:RND superfamily putative drug exporter
MALLGDRAWTLPGWLDRILPHISLEGEEGDAAGAGSEPTAAERPPEPEADGGRVLVGVDSDEPR